MRSKWITTCFKRNWAIIGALIALGSCEKNYTINIAPDPKPSDTQLTPVPEEDDPNKPSNPPQLLDQRDKFSVTFEKGKVDILFVIDNSGSMAEEILTTRDSFEDFIESFISRSLDFQIGVMSTDTQGNQTVFSAESVSPNPYANLLHNGPGSLLSSKNPEYPRIIKRPVDLDSSNSALREAAKQSILNAFAANINLPTTRDIGTEAGLLATAYAIERKNGINGWNYGFFRSDARLSVVIISDEDESYGIVKSPQNPTTDKHLQELIPEYTELRLARVEAAFKSIKDPLRPDLWRVDTISAYPKVDSCPAYSNSTVLPMAAARFGGKAINLCAVNPKSNIIGDFSDDLIELGSSIAAQVERNFKLKKVPNNPSKILVRINNTLIPFSPDAVQDGWTYKAPNSMKVTAEL